MFEFIANAFNTSVLAATQLLLSTVLSTNPWFENVQLQVSPASENILCSVSLQEDFASSLDEVLMSGETISLRFSFELLDSGMKQMFVSSEVQHGFRYNVLSDTYLLLLSEEGELKEYQTFEEARRIYTSVMNLAVMETADLDENLSYVLRITAEIDPVQGQSLSQSVNLTLLWVSVKPTYLSESFSLDLPG